MDAVKEFELTPEVYQTALDLALNYDKFWWSDFEHCMQGLYVKHIGLGTEPEDVELSKETARYDDLSDILLHAMSDMRRQGVADIYGATLDSKRLPLVADFIQKQLNAGAYKFVGLPE